MENKKDFYEKPRLEVTVFGYYDIVTLSIPENEKEVNAPPQKNTWEDGAWL